MRHLVIIAAILCIPSCEKDGETSEVKVVNGDAVSVLDYPSVVSLAVPGRLHECTGTCIGNRAILTAAHCDFRSGPLAIGPDPRRYQTMNVKVVVPPGYQRTTKEYDYALVILPARQNICTVVRPICDQQPAPGQPIEIVGFGGTQNSLESTGFGAMRRGTNNVGAVEALTINYQTDSGNHHGLGDVGDAISAPGDSGGPLFRRSGPRCIFGSTSRGSQLREGFAWETDTNIVTMKPMIDAALKQHGLPPSGQKSQPVPAPAPAPAPAPEAEPAPAGGPENPEENAREADRGSPFYLTVAVPPHQRGKMLQRLDGDVNQCAKACAGIRACNYFIIHFGLKRCEMYQANERAVTDPANVSQADRDAGWVGYHRNNGVRPEDAQTGAATGPRTFYRTWPALPGFSGVFLGQSQQEMNDCATTCAATTGCNYIKVQPARQGCRLHRADTSLVTDRARADRSAIDAGWVGYFTK